MLLKIAVNLLIISSPQYAVVGSTCSRTSTYYYSTADSKDETVQSSELLLHNSITIIQLSRSKSQCRSNVVLVVRNTDDFSSPRGNNAISCFHCSHIQISCFSPDEVTCSVTNLISQTPCYLWVPDGRSYCIVLYSRTFTSDVQLDTSSSAAPVSLNLQVIPAVSGRRKSF